MLKKGYLDVALNRAFAFFGHACAVTALILANAAEAAPAAKQWFGLWSRSAVPLERGTTVRGTVRFRIASTMAGDQIRLRLTNEYGASDLLVGGLTIARGRPDGSPDPASLIRMTFGGKNEATIPAGTPLFTDPASLPIAAGEDLIVSIYYPEGVTLGMVSPIPMLVAVSVNALKNFDGAKFSPVAGRPPVTMAAIRSSGPARVIVAIGDSITDSISTKHVAWPERLAARLASRGGRPFSVLNAGISGNRLRISGYNNPFGEAALARFDRDVLSVPGVTHVVIFEGINDLGLSGGGQANIGEKDARPVPTAEQLIDAIRQLAARARAHGAKAIGGTITPFEGATGDPAKPYFTPEKEVVRCAVNAWIRSTPDLDAHIDFERAIGNPAVGYNRLLDRFAEPDRLHPSAAGQQAMADAIDLRILD